MSRALRLVAIAFACAFVLHLLQTILLQVVPYDTTTYDVLVGALRVAFVVADLLLAGAFVELARRGPHHRPLALAIAVFAVANLVTSLVQPSLAEQAFAFALTIATLLLLPSIARAPRGLWLAVAAGVASVLGPVLRLASSGESAVALAWARWIVELVRLGALGALALGTRPPVDAAAPAAGPYRSAADGAPAATVALPEETRQKAAAGLSRYRTGYVGRIAATIVTTGLVFVLELARERDMPVLLLLAPIASLVATSFMFRGLLALRSYASASVACFFLLVGMCCDGVMLLYGVVMLVERSRSSAFRRISEGWALSWFLVAFTGAIALVLAVVAVARLGRALDAREVVVASRRVHAALLSSFGFSLAALCTVATEPRREGAALAAGLAIAAAGAAIATVVTHLLQLRGTLSALAKKSA